MNTVELLEGFRWSTRTRPPVPECVIAFAKVMGHENDTVASIYVDKKDQTCAIRFEWCSRGCVQDEEYEVPLSVLEADDVSLATTIWKLDDQLFNEERELQSKIRDVMESEQRIAELRHQLEAAKAASAQGATGGVS